MTAPDKLGNWFQCQHCEHWLCLRADSKTNTTWLQPGIRVNEKIYEITITQAVSLPGSVPAASSERSYDKSVPATLQTLETIQIERAEVKRNLNAIEIELRRLAALMSTSNTATIERINSEITKVKNAKESLLAREKELLAQKNNLEAKKREKERISNPPMNTPSKPTKENQSAAFGCSAVLVAAALILFGVKVNIVWNVNAFLWLTGIALAGGFIFWISYNVD
ncbi:MAG: hypothetical protein IPO36_11205 [Anaerolineales bacterium]|nr:hypothetical protein [Anaerolineales bacterium]